MGFALGTWAGVAIFAFAGFIGLHDSGLHFIIGFAVGSTVAAVAA